MPQLEKNLRSETALNWDIVDIIAARKLTKNPLPHLMSDSRFNVFVRLGKHYDAADRALGLPMEYYTTMLNSSKAVAKSMVHSSYNNAWTIDDLRANLSPSIRYTYNYLEKIRCVTPFRTSYGWIIEYQGVKYFKIGPRIFDRAALQLVISKL